MKKLLVLIFVFVVFEAQAIQSDHLYSKVDEIQSVVEWLEAAERGVKTISLEQGIQEKTNRLFTVVKQVNGPDTFVTEEHVAYLLAHTQKFMSLVTVEQNQIRFYFGAAPSDYDVFGSMIYEGYAFESDPLEINFSEALSVIYGINESLHNVFDVSPLDLKKDLTGVNSLRIGEYSLIRADINMDLPEPLLEDFLLLVWSMLEQNLSYPRFQIVEAKTCGKFLNKPNFD